MKTSTLEILRALIRFDTTSAHSNLDLLNYVQTYLNQYGVDSQLIYNSEENKANLYATMGPKMQGGVMLSGHTDTVPVVGQKWQTNPYELTEEAGCYYGRGTADMKSFLAIVLAAVPAMVKSKLNKPIHLAFSYDEEIGCVGVRRLIDSLQQHPYKPSLCIIGEPTGMQVVTAHKGKLAAQVCVKGKSCHSGMAPFGVNAVNYAARLIVFLEQLAQEKQSQGPFEDGHEIPYTTVHTGEVEGGVALNIVPEHCRFSFEIRNIAAEDPHALLRRLRDYADEVSIEMQQSCSDCTIEINVVTEYPGLSTPSDADVVSFVQALTDVYEHGNISFGTEGGLFSQLLGVSTVICGPGYMSQGHQPDEFIHISQIDYCEYFIERLIQCLCR
jgi:acetylornithine deacetylase